MVRRDKESHGDLCTHKQHFFFLYQKWPFCKIEANHAKKLASPWGFVSYSANIQNALLWTELAPGIPCKHRAETHDEKRRCSNEMLTQPFPKLRCTLAPLFPYAQKPVAHFLADLHLSPVSVRRIWFLKHHNQRIFGGLHSKPPGWIALRNQPCQKHTVTLYQCHSHLGPCLLPPHLSAHSILNCLWKRLSFPVARARNWPITVPDKH